MKISFEKVCVNLNKINWHGKDMQKQSKKSDLSPELDETIKRIIEGKEKLKTYTFDEHKKQVKKILEEE